MKLPKVEFGEVFQVSLSKGYGLIQCVKEAPKDKLEIIRALPGIYGEEDLDKLHKIILLKELFFLQLPVKYAIKQKLLKSLGKFPVPINSEAPRYFRTEHMIGTEFICWHVVDSETLQIKSTKGLSPEEQKLSEWDVISIPDLAEKIESGWSPEVWK